MQVPGIYLLVLRRLPAIVSAVPSATLPRIAQSISTNRKESKRMSLRKTHSSHLLNAKKMLWLTPAFVVASAGVLLILFSAPDPSHGQTISSTQITLSCNDGHSVIFEVDQITLTSLLADVQAINASGTGTSCTLTMAAIDPSSKTTKWTVYDYNPSNQAIAPRNSPNSMPAMTTNGTTSFPFKLNTYTALLTTTDASLTGDLSLKTLNVTVSVSGGMGTFQDQHNGGCTPDTKSVRFYFASPKASGTTGTGTTGFYTQFWWSNPMSVPLATDPQGPMGISQPVNAP